MTPPTLTLRKTRTAAEYVHARTRSAELRDRAAEVLRVVADVDAAEGSPATLRDVVVSVADCAGPEWLEAHADDPDVRRLKAFLENPVLLPGDPAELDELLATVLWARHGPEPADS